MFIYIIVYCLYTCARIVPDPPTAQESQISNTPVNTIPTSQVDFFKKKKAHHKMPLFLPNSYKLIIAVLLSKLQVHRPLSLTRLSLYAIQVATK